MWSVCVILGLWPGHRVDEVQTSSTIKLCVMFYLKCNITTSNKGDQQ